jgi:hypothetical protein
MRLERKRTATIPNGSIFMFCWNSRLRIAVARYEYFAYAVRAAR